MIAGQSTTIPQQRYENPALQKPQAEINQQFAGIIGHAEASAEYANPEVLHAIGYTAVDAMSNLDALMAQQGSFENLSLDNKQTQEAAASEEGLDALAQPSFAYDTMANAAPVNMAAVAAMHEQMNRDRAFLNQDDDEPDEGTGARKKDGKDSKAGRKKASSSSRLN